MIKLRGKIAILFTVIITVLFLSDGLLKAYASDLKVPQIQFVTSPITEYEAGDRIKFDINAPNFAGKVEYRVVLWDDNKKSYSDLWNSSNGYPGRYYTKWQPSGTTTFNLGWVINEPGSYRITVYVKRVGVTGSKLSMPNANCDSYIQSVAFKVNPKGMVPNTPQIPANDPPISRPPVVLPTSKYPQIKFVTSPSTEYTAGDRVKFDIHAPNYAGKVEYRVVLWDDNKKSYSDLWNSSNGYPGRYYTKWQPTGTTTFNLGWVINEPGSYRITVYAKRVGVTGSKLAQSGANCDSYIESKAFEVKSVLSKNNVTLDSSFDEVKKLLGNPLSTKVEGDTYILEYSNATIFVAYSIKPYPVLGWNNKGNNKISLGEKVPSAPPIKIGSTMDDVVKAMGTPKYIHYDYIAQDIDYWVYGDNSAIFFDNNEKVMAYINKGSLKVSLGEKVSNASPINSKSTKSDVVKLMGTPDMINSYEILQNGDAEELGLRLYTDYGSSKDYYLVDLIVDYTYYQYGDSFVLFDEGGQLVNFLNTGNLKINYGEKDSNSTGVKVGSTEEEIVKAMGTPEAILDAENSTKIWVYGDSYILVNSDGKVLEWENNGDLNVTNENNGTIKTPAAIASTK
jgi:outer membrane protein assembly factor BamE (lipoprotein component of BamABCDE complex)